ncbi:multiple sugar transport system substrate-binding protein [Motilibacter peucedani]|uniref:Multiple sugar transport system substrate-binding protein n=1 Tax=Motilibacter peucedani TaxID=598650 RepID=A0A420XUF9_9ACTN|nr:ABC transporter substrate-binding protein [Motilibacter peucedani]RKS80465.1 multiple sugar transport system substrate-binding protein [Motilibacter peucedani]
MQRKIFLLAAAAAVAATTLTGCGGSSSPGKAAAQSGQGGGTTGTIKIAYQRFGENRIMDNFLAGVKTEYEAANPGSKVELDPIVASENDYYTKLALMLKSSKTSPDLVYEDTFLINSDIKAGYLKPLDSYLSSWDQWSQFEESAKGAAKGQDGKTYGVPDGTDTRALWYSKDILKKAGIPVPWQPKTWDDVLTAARAVKAKVPGVTPFNIYSSKAAGEASTMQGFEMLLYGTGGTLYDDASKKWVVGSPHFVDSLKFVKTVFDEKLGPDAQDATDAQLSDKIQQQWLPNGKLAIALDGSWITGSWLPTGGKPWPQWSEALGQTPMPTQKGQAPGRISLSGGWTWAISAKSDHADAAWKFIQAAQTEKNAAKYAVAASQIAVRKDVAADASYTAANSKAPVFSEVVAVTKYRPAYPEYPQISNQIQVAMESVMTGQSSPEDAAKAYDESVKGIVGDDGTTTQ